MAKQSPLPRRRIINVGIAALVALSFLVGAHEATASCGDYLVPLGQSSEMQAMHGRPVASQDGQSKHPLVPCSGPSCGQAPTNDNAMTVVAEPARDHQPVTLLMGKMETVELPLTREWDVRRQAVKEMLENGGLFRPPRLIVE